MLGKSPDSELQFLKRLIFPRALKKLQNRVNFRVFYLKCFCVSIFNKMVSIVSVKPN